MYSDILNYKVYLLLPLTLFLISCDGKPKPIQPSATDIIQLDSTQNINQSVDLVLYLPSENITNIEWQQTNGTQVSLLRPTSKVISFTPTEPGDYSFNVSFSVNGGELQNLEKTVTVEDVNNKITARLSHSVQADNQVSFRAHLATAIDLTSLKWQQQEGPKVTFTSENNEGQLAIFFNAPQVNNDSLVSFKVTATDSSTNTTFEDQVAVLIEPASPITDNAYFSDRKAIVFPYNNTSPYADSLVNCIYSNTLTSSCTLAQTPLLAEEVKTSTEPPSITMIMDRVLVSHRWMGDRFKEYLINNDTNNDIKNLLRATTAIVIAYDVRPSFYWAATGAIYLDAENFWLTPEERDTINEAPDFRADFGKDLQFVMPWRYVRNNDYASKRFSITERLPRSAEDGLYRLMSLMYHELAHANDFFPSYEWYIHNSNERVLDAARSSDYESDKLAISLPLASQKMVNLGQVSFAGESATNTQKSYLPIDIESFFKPDRASDYYAYSSLREDYAMLFEELMMHNRFNVIRDVAITNQPSGSNISASDYIVTWGQRGRIGDNKLLERVLFSASRVLPEFDSQTAISELPQPIPMIVGDDWLENLSISTNPIGQNNEGKTRNGINIESGLKTEKTIQNQNFIRYYHKPLPGE
jgi:hypothetical protein